MKLDFVKSKTDVITNSSTEVYTYYPDNSGERIYAMIQSILDVSGTDLKAQDVVKVRLEPNSQYYDEYEKDLKDGTLDRKEFPNDSPTDEDLIKYILSLPGLRCDKWSEMPIPAWDAIRVEATKPKYKTIAENISMIINLADHDACFNG